MVESWNGGMVARCRRHLAILFLAMACSEPRRLVGTYDALSVDGVAFPLTINSTYVCSAELRLLEGGDFALNSFTGKPGPNGSCVFEAGLSMIGQWGAESNAVTLIPSNPAFSGNLEGDVLTLDEIGAGRHWIFNRRK